MVRTCDLLRGLLLGRGDAGSGCGRRHRPGIGPRQRPERRRSSPAFWSGICIWFLRRRSGVAPPSRKPRMRSFVLVRYAGALYLLYLAYKLWTAPAKPLTDTDAAALPTAACAVSRQLDAYLEQSEADAVLSRIAPHRRAARVPERLRTSRDRGGDRPDFAPHARGLRAARGARADDGCATRGRSSS